ncbi:phosphoribosylpyrophosphate synthetase [Bdellovibrio sp. HCB337]|uniref:phosphoribosylpyrophosphate synthetase n=1 Tax=Bdellovibrio sp. HCB337 TaxID=3394358 RepID=UPI0039A72348
METERLDDIMQAGTGFMADLSSAIRAFVKQGYTENLTLKIDHFECCSGKQKIYTQEFEVDNVVRFENTSDPDDQSILYAISAPKYGIKGLYVEAYGIYQDEQSHDMIEKFKHHRQ